MSHSGFYNLLLSQLYQTKPLSCFARICVQNLSQAQRNRTPNRQIKLAQILFFGGSPRVLHTNNHKLALRQFKEPMHKQLILFDHIWIIQQYSLSYLPTSFSILRMSSSSGLRFNERSKEPICSHSILPSPSLSNRVNASRYSTKKILHYTCIATTPWKWLLIKARADQLIDYLPSISSCVGWAILSIGELLCGETILYVRMQWSYVRWWMKCSIRQGSPGIIGWGHCGTHTKLRSGSGE